MPRKVTLAPHLTLRQIQENYKNSQDIVEARRWHLLWKVGIGWTVKNSAIAVGLSYEYARKIVKRYNEQGEITVTNQRNRTRNYAYLRFSQNSLLTQEQFQKLRGALKARPDDGRIWTGPKVARWIEKETGREKIHNQRGWKYLKKCGYSWKVPRPSHRKGDPKQQQEFKETLPDKVKNIQKQYPYAKIEVWFFDEHRAEWQLLRRKFVPKSRSRKPPTLQEAIVWIARLGGFLARKGDGNPGLKTLWRGFSTLHYLLEGAELASKP